MDKIELIFNMYKDTDIGTRKLRAIISKKYKLSDIEISNIYAKINNYQIKKYGEKLGKGSDVDFLTREECRKRASVVRTVRYQKKKEKEKNYDK